VAVSKSAFLPIDIWVDPFEPRHSQNYLIRTKGCDKEDFLVFHASKSKFEFDHAIGMN
jgi:hypothetical protein